MAREDNLTHFSSTYQPKNPGRKPSHLKKYLKDNNLGTMDIRHILGSIIPNINNMDKLKKMSTDESLPPIIRIPLICIIKDLAKGKMDSLTWLMRYGYGEPKQEIETKPAGDDPVNMTPEERKQVERELLKEIIKENKNLIKEIINEQSDPD